MSSLDGDESPGGRFNCPHGICSSTGATPTPELWVADRGTACTGLRLDWSFLRAVGEVFLNSPTAFASDGANMVVAELYARLAVVGMDDQLVGYLGEDDQARQRPGWPNGLGPASSRPVTPTSSQGASTAHTGSPLMPMAISMWPSG